MKLKATGQERKPIPAGNYYAVVVGVYDLGTQSGGKWGDKHQCAIAYELHRKKGVVKDEGGNPLIAVKFYNVAFGKNNSGQKSALREDAEAILGRVFTDDEAKSGDINTDDFADRNVRISVKHEPKDGGGVWETFTLTPYDEDDPELTSETDTILYDLNPGGPFPDGLPKWVQNKVQKSAEWAKASGKPAGAKPARFSEPADDDDIPF